MGIFSCFQDFSFSEPKSCPRCFKIRWRDVYTREVLSFLAGISLSIFLIVSLVSPWYTIEAYGLPPPLDSLSAIFWWPGMQLFYIPPLNGQRELLVSWDSMTVRNPKDVYMSSMAMGILAWIATQVLLVAIMFGQICKGTSRMFHILSCGFYKWIVILIGFVVLVLVLLSWTIFFVFNQALSEAGYCPGQRPFFPDGPSNSTLSCQGLWCSGFAGTDADGTARYIYGPSAGWVSCVCSTVFIFFIICVSLSVDPWKNTGRYEEIGEKKRSKKRKAPVRRKKSSSKMKLARQRMMEEDDDEEEERLPLRASQSRARSDSSFKNAQRAGGWRTDEEADFVGGKRSKGRGRR